MNRRTLLFSLAGVGAASRLVTAPQKEKAWRCVMCHTVYPHDPSKAAMWIMGEENGCPNCGALCFVRNTE